MNEHIGFIGLGNMGAPIAANLLASGYALTVYNRTAKKAEPLVEKGARRVDRPGEAPSRGGIVITMLADDHAVEEVVGSEEFLEKLGRGGLHLSMSTISPALARHLAKLHEHAGSAYVAAPVFGRPDAAATRKLWVCISGSAAARTRSLPLLRAVGQGIFEFGDDPGAANVVKLAGNFLIVSAMEAMAEAWTLAEKNGLSRESAASFFSETLLACPIYKNYGKAIAEKRYTPAGFRLALGLKDVDLVLGAAAQARAPMPLASLLHDRLLAAMARGRQDMDWSALALGASEDAGLP